MADPRADGDGWLPRVARTARGEPTLVSPTSTSHRLSTSVANELGHALAR